MQKAAVLLTLSNLTLKHISTSLIVQMEVDIDSTSIIMKEISVDRECSNVMCSHASVQTEQQESSFSVDHFIFDDAAIEYYTGLED